MSSARIGIAPGRPCPWSAAHWLTSRPKRSDQARIVQPEPPACALAMAVNSARQAMTLPKSRSSAWASPAGGLGKPGGRMVAAAAERIEIDLVQDHGARRNQLLALEAVDLEHGRACPVEGRKARANGVQPPQRAAVVVFVMAHQQPL